MTKEHDRHSTQSSETGTDGTNDDSEESGGGIRRRSVIAATLGSPALLGLSFGAADHFALPGPSGPAMSGAASPVERAQAGDPVFAQMDSVTSSIGEEPAQNLPMNDYHVLQASQEVFDTLEREPGEQVRVTREEDTAVFTLAEEVEPTDREDEADAPDDEPDDEELAAAVEFSDQTTDGTTVTVDSARLDEGGFVVIHDSSLLEGEVIGSVIGASEYLEPGENEDLEVELDEPLETDDTLIAMPHQDTNDNQTYDFTDSEGEDDGPYLDDAGEAIIDDAEVTVEDGTGVGDDTGVGNETEDDTGVGNETEDDTGVGNETNGDTGVGNETGDDTGVGNETNGDTSVGNETNGDTGVGNETNGDTGVGNETNGETGAMAQQAGAVVRASTEGKCRLAFYEDGEFEDDRRWGPLRGDETCDLADEEFEVEINPRVPAEDLTAEEAEADGEMIETYIEGETDVAVIAPHGGRIQPYTDQQVELMIEEVSNVTAWWVQGYGQDTSFYRWYVPSAEMSAASFPELARLSEETYDLAVSFNGISGENIYVGGTADESLRQDIADAIEEALPHDASPVLLGENQYAADSSQTLVNRITEGESNGIWIGQPIADRRNNWDVIVEAVASVVSDA